MVLMDGARSFVKKNKGRRLGLLSHPKDLRRAASNLFQAIRKLDKMNLRLIVAEKVPARGIGLAIMDRLKNEVPIFKREELDAPGGGSRWVGELPHESR